MSRFLLFVASSGTRVKIVSVVLFIVALVITHNLFKPVSTKMTLSQIDSNGNMRQVEFVVFDLNLSLGNIIHRNTCLGYKSLQIEGDDDFSNRVIADFMQSTMRSPLREGDLIYKIINFVHVAFPLTLAIITYALLIIVRRRAIAQSLCFGCGYSLVGLDSVVCPECGKKRDL